MGIELHRSYSYLQKNESSYKRGLIFVCIGGYVTVMIEYCIKKET